MLKISSYDKSWSPEIEVNVESVCININGQKAYVFLNKEFNVLGVNLFDSDGTKTLSFYGNEPEEVEDDV